VVARTNRRVGSEAKRNGNQGSNLSAERAPVLAKGEHAVVAVREMRAGLGGA
jgi:hypothetical protein